jgi:hypothetical protein
MSLYRRQMEYDIKEIVSVKPISHEQAINRIEQCKDPVFRAFAQEIYTQIYNNFQPLNANLLVGFRQAATPNPVFMINNAKAPFNGFEVGAIMNPPVGIKANFPTIITNPDGTLNIEIKYDFFQTPHPPEPVRRPRSASPPRQKVSKYSPERPLKSRNNRSSSSSEDPKPSPTRGRRSQSVARETKPKARASSKSRGRSQTRKKKSSSEEEEEPKPKGFFKLW